MPRPKVQPDQRKRVAQACLQCKASKKKCNASLPCSHCVRRGQGDSCQFPNDGETDTAAHSTNGPPPTWKLPSPATGEKRTREESSRAIRDATNNPSLASSDVVFSPDVTSHGSRKGEALNSTRPRMLSNTHGEQLYIGGAASLSFLQLVRETVTQVIGSSEISEYSKKNQMLEVDVYSEYDYDQRPSVDDKTRQQCLDHFFLVTSGLLDVMDRQEATQMIASDTDGAEAFTAAIGLTVLAIGAQGLAASQETTKLKHSAFSRAQHLAFSGMLENPSLDMTRAFLLMSFYMIGACRRNAAFMYLGIAARSALALGLHNTESYKVLSVGQSTLRHKTWKSLVCLDQAVSSILGRAPATTPQRDAGDRPAEPGSKTDDYTNPTLQASYQLALLVDDITGKLYGSKSVTVEAAEMYLQTLRSWSESLPPDLRLSGPSQTNAKYSEVSMVASLHVSAFYYFAVMLITRPFLVADLTRNLAMSQGGRPSVVTEDEELESGKLASSCVNAAIYMAQTCTDMLEMNTLPQDMRLLKAWIFAAGLVLGFQIFGDKDQDVEVERAFASTRNVLKHLADKSPQAAHYFDILTYLSNAITKQRQIREARKRRRTEPLVDRIMNLSGQDPSRPSVHPEFQFHTPDQALLPDSTFDLSFANNLELDPQLMQQDFNNVMFGWDSSSLSLWDQFPFDVGNLGSPSLNANGP